MARCPYCGGAGAGLTGAEASGAGAVTAGGDHQDGLSQGPKSGRGRPKSRMNKIAQKAAMPKASGIEARKLA
jgi:hypothetical protein